MSYGTKTVAGTATLIVSNNTMRQSIIIVNTSRDTVYLGPDSSVTKDNGIALQQDGSLCEDSGGTRMFMGDIYGVTTGGNADIRYWERLRDR